MTRKRKQRKTPEIPQKLTANITESMRAEMGGEEFETVSSTAPQESEKSLLSVCSTQTSLASKEEPRAKVLEKEETHEYQNDLLSAYDGTCGTVSFESMRPISPTTAATVNAVSTIGTYPPETVYRLQMIPVPPMTIHPPAKEVTHKEFVAGTRVGDKNLPSLQFRFSRGEAEMHLINTLMNEIQKTLASSKRRDLKVRSVVKWEKNGMPSLKVVIVRRLDPPAVRPEEVIPLVLTNGPVLPPQTPLCGTCKSSSFYANFPCPDQIKKCMTIPAEEVIRESFLPSGCKKVTMACPPDSLIYLHLEGADPAVLSPQARSLVSPELVSQDLIVKELICGNDGMWKFILNGMVAGVRNYVCFRYGCSTCKDFEKSDFCPEGKVCQRPVEVMYKKPEPQECRMVTINCPQQNPNFLFISRTGDPVTISQIEWMMTTIECSGQGEWILMTSTASFVVHSLKREIDKSTASSTSSTTFISTSTTTTTVPPVVGKCSVNAVYNLSVPCPAHYGCLSYPIEEVVNETIFEDGNQQMELLCPGDSSVYIQLEGSAPEFKKWEKFQYNEFTCGDDGKWEFAADRVTKKLQKVTCFRYGCSKCFNLTVGNSCPEGKKCGPPASFYYDSSEICRAAVINCKNPNPKYLFTLTNGETTTIPSAKWSVEAGIRCSAKGQWILIKNHADSGSPVRSFQCVSQ